MNTSQVQSIMQAENERRNSLLLKSPAFTQNRFFGAQQNVATDENKLRQMVTYYKTNQPMFAESQAVIKTQDRL